MSTEIFSGDYNVSMTETIHYRTLITPFESGKEQRRAKWSVPIRMWDITYKGRQYSRMQEIWTFYKNRQGAYDTFYFENGNDSPISLSGDEHLGIGNGITTIYNFNRYPVKSGDCNITVGGISQIEGVDYTVNYTNGSITFVSIPASGATITATDYRFYYICRFAEDNMNRELFAYRLYNAGLKIVQVI